MNSTVFLHDPVHVWSSHMLFYMYMFLVRGYHGRHRMVVGFTTTYMQSVYITTDVSSNLEQGEVYNIMG